MSHATASAPLAPTRRPLPPGPRGHFLLGMIPELRRDLLGMYRDLARQYGDVVAVPFLGVTTFALSHPDHFKHVLQDHNRNYRRNTFFNNIVKLFNGENLFTTDGDDWLWRRRLMQPAFHRQRVTAFGALMTDSAGAMLDRWQTQPDGQPLWVDREMMQLTLRVAGKALFGVDLVGESRALGEAFTHTSEFVNYRLGAPFPVPLFIPTRRNREFRRAAQTLDRTIYALIRERRRSGEDRGDLLTMLTQARDEDTGESLNDEQVRNEIALMMFAGHETTAVTLTWTFYLLSGHPEVECQLHAELADVLGGRAPTIQDLPDLRYTRMVIEESMRLYPPAWGVARQSVQADEIGGYHIPADAGLSLIINNVHRDPRWWPDPEKFDPGRFTPERSADRPGFAYLPFGGGPRLCIGNQFAMTEAQMVLATIAQRYKLRLVPGHPVRPNPIFVLRTSHGLPMTPERR